jgi:hypothetical protein
MYSMIFFGSGVVLISCVDVTTASLRGLNRSRAVGSNFFVFKIFRVDMNYEKETLVSLLLNGLQAVHNVCIEKVQYTRHIDGR